MFFNEDKESSTLIGMLEQEQTIILHVSIPLDLVKKGLSKDRVHRDLGTRQ